MDIANYIGLFLQKNKYCCLQGLGNLEIKKTPSKHNGTELIGSVYFAKLNPVGSLDDAFPNFVATNEQVSIARASNGISEFIKHSKATIAEGGSVEIPSVGKYLLKNNQLHFELDSAFSMPTNNIVFPIVEKPKQVSETPPHPDEKPYDGYTSYNNYNKPSTVNWNMIAFWSVIAIIGGSILFWSIRYIVNQQQHDTPSEATAAPQVQSSTVIPQDTSLNALINDTAAQVVNTPATTSTVSVSDTPEFKFVIKSYKTMLAAQKREKQLNSYGYNVTIVEKDSTNFLIVKAMKVPLVDTSRMKDSLSRVLNPSGITILH